MTVRENPIEGSREVHRVPLQLATTWGLGMRASSTAGRASVWHCAARAMFRNGRLPGGGSVQFRPSAFLLACVDLGRIGTGNLIGQHLAVSREP